MRDVDIIWDELVDAFENDDPGLIYLLDRLTGEIYLIPADYDDEEMQKDISDNSDQYLHIPGYDYEQERLILYEFIQSVDNENLKQMLSRAYSGKLPYGKVEEILSFYPDDMERLIDIRESYLSERIRCWLEENDLFAGEALL